MKNNILYKTRGFFISNEIKNVKVKNTLIVLLTLISVITTTSCNKKLDIVPEGSPSSATFWKTESDAVSGANALYSYFDDENFYGRGYWWFINASDDMITGRIKAQADNIKDFNPGFIGGAYTEGQWQMRYAVIKRANDIINNVPRIKMSDPLKNRILGEAYFMSGLMYFQLAANYGNDKAGVPIAKREDPSNGDAVPRAANVGENYKYIVEDLKKAASLLPYFETYTSADYGRPHKTAAWAFLAKTYLYNKDFANAELYADSIINSQKHQLLSEFAQVFTIANNWSKEYIWSATSTAAGSSGWGSILPGVMLENKGWGVYNGWGYYTPTKELFDAFDNNDKRRDATILKPGDDFQFFGQMRKYSSTNSLSGYQFRKYMEPFTYASPIGKYLSPNGDHPTTALALPLLRYAEVILIKAEASLMQGKKADTWINLTRERAGLPKLVNATMNDLKKERRCELAGEWADHHRDLVRWGDAKDAYAKPLHGYSGAVVWAARNYNPDIHNVWPVPQREIDNSGGVVKQNFGW